MLAPTSFLSCWNSSQVTLTGSWNFFSLSSIPKLDSPNLFQPSWKTPWHSISQSHLGDYRILQSASAPLFSPFFSISHVDSDTKIGAQWSCIFRSPMPFSIPADHYLGKPKRSLKSCFLLTQFRMWRVLLSAIIIQGKIAWYTTMLGTLLGTNKTRKAAFTMTPIQSQGRSVWTGV